MPGLDFYHSSPTLETPVIENRNGYAHSFISVISEMERKEVPHNPDVYYNARLDPKNYLDGPLSWNPATRLRQMLARPGIVVGLTHMPK